MPDPTILTIFYAACGGGGRRWEQGIDPSSGMARPASIGTVGVTLSGTGGVGDWSTGSYTYDGVGNITAMGSETYSYDEVSRLVSSSRGGGENYTFDPFGNLTNMNGLPRTTDPVTNRLTEAAYDRRGNLLSWAGYTFTRDTLGRMTSMQGPGINRSMFYDAKGERLVVRDGTTYTFTLRDLGQQVLREVSWSNASSWTWGRDYIYRGGTLLASQSTTAGEGLRYHFPDHLTSARLVTNRCGERAVEHRTSSFGLDLPSGSAQSADRMRFTMHERDLGQLSTTLDDLDVMHARTYWPSLGRFTSVDPGRDHDPKVPQSWNLYAYVRGNPLNSFDPDGRDTYLVNRFLSGDFLSPLLTGRSAAGPNTLITHTFIAIVDERGMVTKTYSWGNEPDQHNALAEGRWFADEEEDLIAGQQSVRLGLARKVGEADLDPYVTQAFARVANRVEDPSNHPNRIIADNCKHEAKKLLQAARRLQRWDEVKKRRGEREEKRVLVKETEQKHER